jgi:hypothetical protein
LTKRSRQAQTEIYRDLDTFPIARRHGRITRHPRPISVSRFGGDATASGLVTPLLDPFNVEESRLNPYVHCQLSFLRDRYDVVLDLGGMGVVAADRSATAHMFD